jgi:hypothetical protein
VNVGEDTALCDCDVAEQLVQLLIVPDGELEMAGNDTGLLVVAGSVTCQLENFGSEILQDSSQIDGSAGTDTLGIVALAEQTMDTTNGESETGLRRTTVNDIVSKRDSKARSGREDPNGQTKPQSVRWKLTIARSWNRWPCRRICHLQSL